MDVETETTQDWAKDVDTETPSLISDVKISLHVTVPLSFYIERAQQMTVQSKVRNYIAASGNPFISLSVLVKSISLTKQNIRN